MAAKSDVEMMVDAMKSACISRHVAAEVLHKVADAGSYGSYPHDVTCEELGKALWRIVMNSQEPDPLLGIITGYRAAETERNRQLQSI